MSQSWLILFDIDCTLMRTAGAGMAALTRALGEVLGESLAPSKVSPDGKTDPIIIRAMLAEAGLPPTRWAEWERRILEVYPQLLEEELQSRRSQSRLEKGVLDLLLHLHGDPRFHLGVLTGNIERTARLKLGLFDLNPYFPIGAFGCDCADRNRLGGIALERARRYYKRPFEPAHTWFVGDTDRDIQAARATGARVLAVATGGYSRAQLEEFCPDHCLDELEPLESVLKIFDPERG